MKIVITGGGTGGHFYPLIAVADKIIETSEERKLLSPTIYYLADKEYDRKLLLRKGIYFKKITAGKRRTYSSAKNILDVFKMAFGVIRTFFTMFSLYPDVVFTNGSYIAFPVLVACRILRIPVVVHSSDTVPGRVVLYGSKFADKISVAFKEASDDFREKDREKVAWLGNPVRDEIKKPLHNGAREFLELDTGIPTILILGGSSGAMAMNDAVVDALPKLLMRYNIIHQCGRDNHDEVFGRTEVVLYDHPYKGRYKLYPYLDDLAIRMSSGAAALVISRAGAGSIFEIAQWGLPAIVIPIPNDISRDQEKNAFAYARTGAATVMLQNNTTAGLLTSEIDRIVNDPTVQEEMKTAAKKFAKPNAAEEIANAVIDIGLSHEQS